MYVMSHARKNVLGIAAAGFAITLYLALIYFGAFTEPDHATRIAKDKGYTRVHVTGYHPFACTPNDFYKTGFEARNESGRIVRGVVCGNPFQTTRRIEMK